MSKVALASTIALSLTLAVLTLLSRIEWNEPRHGSAAAGDIRAPRVSAARNESIAGPSQEQKSPGTAPKTPTLGDRRARELVARFVDAIESEDVAAIDGAMSAIFADAQLEEILAILIDMLPDGSYDVAVKRYVAALLVRADSKAHDPVFALLSAATVSHFDGDRELEAALLAALCFASSLDDVDEMLTFLTLNDVLESGDELPASIRRAITKSIRGVPDSVDVAGFLAERYLSDETTDQEAESILDLRHVGALARLAGDSYAAGDLETARRLLSLASSSDDSAAALELIELAAQESVPLEDLSSVTGELLARRSEPRLGVVGSYLLGERDATPEQRALAASIVGRAASDDATWAALRKALDYEQNPLVRSSLAEAVERMESRRERQASPPVSPESNEQSEAR